MCKKFIYFIVFSLSFQLQAQVNAYTIGQNVNNVSGTDVHGNSFDIYSHCEAGRYVFIKFYTSTCSYCQSITPIFNEFYQKYGCNQFEIACVSINGYTDNTGVLAFEEQYGGLFMDAPSISTEGGSTQFINRFLPGSYPTVCVISPDKKLIVNQIFPITNIADIETSFPDDFNPMPTNYCMLDHHILTKPYFTLYPNPASDYLTIEFSNNEKIETLTIYNLYGQEVVKLENIVNHTIPLPISAGLYLVEIKTNNTFFTEKLTIKK